MRKIGEQTLENMNTNYFMRNSKAKAKIIKKIRIKH